MNIGIVPKGELCSASVMSWLEEVLINDPGNGLPANRILALVNDSARHQEAVSVAALTSALEQHDAQGEANDECEESWSSGRPAPLRW